MGFSRSGLTFREIDTTDLPMLREWRNDPQMSSGWHDPRSVQTMTQQGRWYQLLDADHQAFIAMDGNHTVGLLRFTLDHMHQSSALTGTDVARDSQNKGYGKRILRAGAEHVLLDLGMHRVTAEALDVHLAAQKIIDAAGFKPCGRLRDYIKRGGRYHDWLIYDLLESELG